MNCAGCRRELDVGDQYIQFTASEWAERNNLMPLAGMDDLMADLMDSGYGENIVFCEDCTQETGNGWFLDTVYGEEAA
jgi:hypothetical protein